MISYGKQHLDDDDYAAVENVLKSSHLTQGPFVEKFEQDICDYVQAKHSVSTTSATAALHLACMSLDIGPRDIVWVPTISFVASSNCALYCGAQVKLLDIDPRSVNLDVEILETELEIAATTGKLPKALIAVHMAGTPCDMRKVKALGEKFGSKLLRTPRTQ